MVERLEADADVLGFHVRLPMRKSKKQNEATPRKRGMAPP
jgi:hypothetical protein